MPTPNQPLPEVKPCPFCGSEAEVREEKCTYCIVCNNIHCYAAMGEGWDNNAMPKYSFHSEYAAIKAWNARNTHQELVEAATELAKHAVSMIGTDNDNPNSPENDKWKALNRLRQALANATKK